MPGDAAAPPPGQPADDDKAWVNIQTPFDSNRLETFLEDVERLLRINSQLNFEEWRDLGDGRYTMKAKNLSNGQTVETELQAERGPGTLRIIYSGGLKAAQMHLGIGEVELRRQFLEIDNRERVHRGALR